MRIVLFCENKYAVDILLPIYQEAVKSETNHILWYVHLPTGRKGRLHLFDAGGL